MRIPIPRELHLKQFAQLVELRSFAQTGKEREAAADIVCQHGQPSVRKILRTQTGELPRRRRQWMQPELILQESILSGQSRIVVVLGMFFFEQSRLPQQKGFDLEMLKAVCAAVDVPVIASGGAGQINDFVSLFEECPDVDAGLAASVFHYGEIGIPELKKVLKENNIAVRL